MLILIGTLYFVGFSVWAAVERRWELMVYACGMSFTHFLVAGLGYVFYTPGITASAVIILGTLSALLYTPLFLVATHLPRGE